MDLLIRNGTVVTMDARRSVRRADVLVSGGRIKKVAPNLPTNGMRRVLDASGKVVIPGLVQAHVHLCQVLFRNRADGLPLLAWLKERIWPFEAAHDPKSLRASADLGIAELLKGGTTAVQDMGTVHHTEAVFEAAKAAGIRIVGGKAMMDDGAGVPKKLKESTRESLEESDALAKRFDGSDGQLHYAYCPRFVLSCTEELMREVASRARANKARIHTHASEHAEECEFVRKKFGADNVEYLHQLGLTGEDVSLAHCVWLESKEEKLLAKTGTNVVHCPSANLKLASGIARIPELLAQGVNVALGGDGAPCNNNLDAFLELRLAALLQKPRLGAEAMPAGDVLHMATMGGAKALGLEDEIGSIEVGKRADLVLLDLFEARAVPAGDDVISQIVYSAQSRHVHTVVLNGEVVVEDGALTQLDEREIVVRAEEQVKKLLGRVK